MIFLTWLFILLGAILALVGFLSHLFYSVTGVWERIDQPHFATPIERIRLAQFGFLIIGKRIVMGGAQSFFGFALGQHLWLRRRDYGLASLVKEGFPEKIAALIEGQVMGKYRLQLTEDQTILFGDFIPLRVEFSVTDNCVTSVTDQSALPRQYKRIESIAERATTSEFA